MHSLSTGVSPCAHVRPIIPRRTVRRWDVASCAVAQIRPLCLTLLRNSRVRLLGGSAEDLLRWPQLADDTRVEECDLAGHLTGEAHLVRGQHHRHAVGLEVADDVEDLADELGVERRRDLVEEHQLGLHREGAHDRDPLLLPAGQPVGVLVGLVAQAETPEQRPAPTARRRPAPYRARGAAPGSRCPGPSCAGRGCRLWKTMPTPLADGVGVGVRAVTSMSSTWMVPASTSSSTVDAAEQRRLARAGRTDEADDLAGATSRLTPRRTAFVPNALRRSCTRSNASLMRAHPPAGGAGRAPGAGR